MKILGYALLAAVVGYAAGVVLGFGLVGALSNNRHDKSMEAGMTAFFFAGPAFAVLAFLGSVAYQLVARRGR